MKNTKTRKQSNGIVHFHISKAVFKFLVELLIQNPVSKSDFAKKNSELLGKISSMAAKSDFAQKLLHDLRLRKERMAATQNTSRQSSQTSRGKILADFFSPCLLAFLQCDAIASMSGKVSDDLQIAEQPNVFEAEDHEESTELYNLSQHEYKQCHAAGGQEQLTEPEKELKEMVIKSQLFLSTAEALFKLNIPVSFLHAGDHDDEVTDKKLILDCGYEVMKRKARRHEVTFHPYTKTTISCTKVRSLDDLVKQLCKDLEMLKFYGGNGSDECDVAASLHKMLNKDINNKVPDVNSMWDFEWSKMMSVFPEKEDVIRDVERHMLNGLLDEITNDLLLISVSV